MNLHEHLRTHHTVRLSNGVEVENPIFKEGHKCSPFCKKCTEYLKQKDKYNQATEAINLPNWVEFWEVLDSSFDHHDSEIVRNIQSEFKLRLSKPPTISEFVAVGKNGEVLEEPNQYIGALEFGEGEGYEKAIEYQNAQDNVIYEGWKLGLNGENLIVIYNGMEKIYFYKNGVISFNGKDITTTDDLNRNVQLYMKIK